MMNNFSFEYLEEICFVREKLPRYIQSVLGAAGMNVLKMSSH